MDELGKMINVSLSVRISGLAMTVLLAAGGCQVGTEPRMRQGSFFGDPMGMVFPEPTALGKHSYGWTLSEQSGMLYTCRGGFIDLGHLRESADRTRFMAKLLTGMLAENKTQLSYRIIEPSWYRLTLYYPPDWAITPPEQKEKIARDVAIRLGQYLAHTSVIWHEMLTWYGYASSGFFPERISSFSWEDPYSDLLGTILGAEALQDTKQSYDAAMTELIERTLWELDVQPASAAIAAERKVYGDWYSGEYYFWVKMKKRSFDVGLDSGFITPWLVPGICPGASPKPIAAPDLRFLKEYGFSAEVKIYPIEFEKVPIYAALKLDSDQGVEPPIHFPLLLAKIRHDAILHFGADVDCPDTEAAGKATGLLPREDGNE